MPEHTNATIEVFSDIICELGESALWDGGRSRFYWVDITRSTLYAREWTSGVTTALAMPDVVGSVALRSGGGLVAALRHAIAYCDVDSGAIEIMRTLETELTGNRFNDGAIDPRGRFWFGSMDMAEAAPTGTFYCFDPDTAVRAAFDGIICSNGPAWGPEGRTIYHVASTRRLVRPYDFDAAAGNVGPGRVVPRQRHPGRRRRGWAGAAVGRSSRRGRPVAARRRARCRARPAAATPVRRAASRADSPECSGPPAARAGRE